MKLAAVYKGLFTITAVLMVLSLIIAGCSKAENDTATTPQNENTVPEVQQSQTTDNWSFPETSPVNGQFFMGLDMVKLSNALGIEQKKVEAAFGEVMKNISGNSPIPFTANMSGMRPPDNFNGQTSRNIPGMQPSENFTGSQRSEMPEGNFRPNYELSDEIIDAVAEILDITPQELEDAIDKTNS
jgi:hypothetical protein